MCTLEKCGNIFLLTLVGDDEHRLNPNLIGEIQSSLSQVRAQAKHGLVIVTTEQGKFFSNGFDLAWAESAGTSVFLHRLQHMGTA
uniref:Uncharacterized protein n=1 Tax=Nelumbo nucifera TaxID=4432 RepID=A0A822Y6M4_NELNU|nr:TPA_asm: hypothetical protein HUJ06_028457 [Nelumbo nucifera]